MKRQRTIDAWTSATRIGLRLDFYGAKAASAMRGTVNSHLLDWLLTLIDRTRRHQRLLLSAMCTCIVVATVGAILEEGVWTRQLTFRGQFQVASGTSAVYVAEIGDGLPFWFSIRVDHSQSSFMGTRLNPRLLAEGHEIALPDMPELEIYQGLSYLLSKGKRELVFPLPDGVTNDQRLLLTVDFKVVLRQNLLDVAVWGGALALLLQLVIAIRSFDDTMTTRENRRGRLGHNLACRVDGLAHVFTIVSAFVIVCCMGYFFTIAYGVYAGDALPTATIFHVVPGNIVAQAEPYLPPAMLLFAAAGAAFAWAVSLRLVSPATAQRTERKLTLLWSWWGVPVILGLFLFSMSAGGWSGHIRSFDQNYMALAGLVPYSDASGYFTDSYRQAIWGGWGVLGSRRPLGEGFRQLTVFAAQYSYVGTLLIQTGSIAALTYLAARCVARWHGIWAAIAFVGFVYIATRSFLPTTLTEPLALIWTLFAIVFLLDALRLSSLPHALIALAGLTFALGTRMGSMFTIPLMTVWIAFAFTESRRGRLQVFAIACGVVVGIGGINGLLGWLYASPNVPTGSNFAWVACGLSLGTNWSDCNHLYGSELSQLADEKAQAMFLLPKAWENIGLHPSVFLTKLGRNSWGYFKDMPRFLFTGYSPAYSASAAFSQIAVLALFAALIFVNRFRSSTAERTFWLLLFTSVVMSAAVVLADDGWRVLHVTHILIACFFATGFTAPAVLAIGGKGSSCRWEIGAAVIITMTALFLITPFWSHKLTAWEIAKHPEIGMARAGENVVPGGRFISGFNVIADGERRPLNVPTIFISEFTEMMRLTHMEDDLGPFVQNVARRVPIAFILAGRFDDFAQSSIYIAPTIVLERPDVWAWRLKLREGPAGEKPWVTLQEALTAVPLR